MSLLISNYIVYNANVCPQNKPNYKKLINTIPVVTVLDDIKRAVTSLGINVIQQSDDSEFKSAVVDTICQSLWVRDSSININNTIILLPGVSNTVREYEWKTHPIVVANTYNSNQLMPKNPESMEGGDVIQDGDRILIGLGRMTNNEGVLWLKKYLNNAQLNKNIITVNHTALHLDCCLCVLPRGELFYSSTYISTLPQCLNDYYKVIDINEVLKHKVKSDLAANILVVGNNIICTDQAKFKPLRKLWRSLGYNVIEIKYGTLWRFGGGIRCLVQWLDHNQQIT
jgi:N-dimethylarginine dimethylaminohydrolase